MSLVILFTTQEGWESLQEDYMCKDKCQNTVQEIQHVQKKKSPK